MVVMLADPEQAKTVRKRTPIGRFVNRCRLRPTKRLRRLEERGLVEPGWSVNVRNAPLVSAQPTALGKRTARAAMVTWFLELGVADFDYRDLLPTRSSRHT